MFSGQANLCRVITIPEKKNNDIIYFVWWNYLAAAATTQTKTASKPLAQH